MLSFRVLMYSCGFIAACVYLANFREVRSLTAEAHHLREEAARGEEDDSMRPGPTQLRIRMRPLVPLTVNGIDAVILEALD